MDNRTSMIRLIVFGDIPERSLKELAYQIEDELGSLPAVSHVETTGTRDYEISIEVPLVRLRALGLTLDDIANAVRRSSLDLSAGSIDTRDAAVRVQTVGQSYDQFDFEEIVILARKDGTAVHLGEIASVRDGFQDTDLMFRHQGRPAVFVEVYRADGEQVMDVAAAVRQHLADVIAPSLPDGVGITIWNDDSQTYSERVDLLVRNGLLGLILVFIALALFLEIRLAVWVVAGLVTSGIGALAVMLSLDLAINTISLFSFVLAVGIIVDDAIVVAEYIHYERMRGTPGLVAAIRGTRRIKKALIFAVLTSVAAFTPLLFIPGGIGEVWTALPVIIIGMLLISLAESLLILPKTPVPPARAGVGADQRGGSVRHAHARPRGPRGEQIPEWPPRSRAALRDGSTCRRGCRLHRPLRSQPVPGAGGDRPYNVCRRRGRRLRYRHS